MAETNEKWSVKLNGQYQELNKKLDKFSKAGKGLLAILKESGSKQFNDLVAAGEKTDDDLFEQVKSSVKYSISDFRGSVNKAKFASRGLFAAVKQNGSKYFEELVNKGEKSNTYQPQQSNETKNNHKQKNSNKAA